MRNTARFRVSGGRFGGSPTLLARLARSQRLRRCSDRGTHRQQLPDEQIQRTEGCPLSIVATRDCLEPISAAAAALSWRSTLLSAFLIIRCSHARLIVRHT